MKKLAILLIAFIAIGTSIVKAQGWPAQYGGVMLQGFYWDSYADTQWSYLEQQSDEISRYFSLIWVPQSGFCGNGNNMGYTPQYYFRQDSSFGSEAQLRSMISTYKKKGTGIIADVVINHRNNLGEGGSWVDYPKETYNGKTYQMLPTDICANDDGGKTKTWANGKGIKISSNNDTGEDWDGCRDLDHKSTNVQEYVKDYLKYLLNDLGYSGFRYDMVKGYSASYTGMYNQASMPKFSVGEYWDGNAAAVQTWINGTKVNNEIQSGAFDFAFRYTCRDAANGSWSKLNGTTSVTNTNYRRYSVTFVENHDTEYRNADAQQDPIRKDTVAVNAWLLANPGTPCVFYKHWMTYKKDIKKMIEARRLVGITNESATTSKGGSSTYCARSVKGTNGELLVVVGPDCQKYSVPTGYTEILSGYHYRYLVSSDCDTQDWAETVKRIDEEEASRGFTPHKATVYVKADFSPLYFYIWDSNNNTQLNGDWPGLQISSTKEINGETWYYQTIDIFNEGYYFNIIFNQGKGKPQTADIGHIDTDRYFIVTLAGDKVNYTDVSATMGIHDIEYLRPAVGPTYDLMGKRVDANAAATHRGIYIQNGKKILR